MTVVVERKAKLRPKKIESQSFASQDLEDFDDMAIEAVCSEAQPPQYSTEFYTNPTVASESPKNGQLQLHRRTSVRIESEPNMRCSEESSDAFSTISSLGSREKSVLRGFQLRLGSIANAPHIARSSNGQWSGMSFESSELGTTVVIEASRPLRKRFRLAT